MGKLSGAVHDGVIAVDDLEDVVRTQPDVVGHHVDVRVERSQRLFGRVDFALANAVHVVQDLPLQIGLVDHVHVDHAERAHAGCGQVQRGWRTETACAEEQHLGVEQLQLALLPYFGQQQVALVAVPLGGRQGLGVAQGRPSSFQRLKPPVRD